ncbi:MAG: CRISPR system precrRNA processing endoribonuclease RAMP protein Cas6 [Candidatus Solibacter usitatus]|nr:CRISPR system precrRNA processing endoribonuclease RAMP protein Cas6 [Candidatus Solibacter usitatus]
MPAGLDFHVLTCRISLRARVPLDLPTPAANRFRGALGFQLPEEIFRPSAQEGPSGLHDRPRPFSLRAHHLDGLSLRPGQAFELSLNLFYADPSPFREAFARLAWAAPLDWSETYHHAGLAAEPGPPFDLRVRFLTPTELKPPVPPGSLPPFATLLARACDRISALRAFYGPGPLDVDHAALRAPAGAVDTLGGDLRHAAAARLSARTGQTHPLGGFTGHVDYAQVPNAFLPWLQAAAFTGVGRQTVWGNGIIAVERIVSPA